MSLRLPGNGTRSCFALLAIAACATFAHPASAEDPASKRARVLFEEGRQLAKEERYAEACPKLVASYQLVSGIGTEFNLADCWQHLGKTELARSLFLDVAQKSREAGQAQRAALASARAAALASAPVAQQPQDEPEVEASPRIENVPEVVVKERASTPDHAETPATTGKRDSSDAALAARLREEYSALAEASVQIQALRDRLAQLAPRDAARARALAKELAVAQRELDASWLLAGRVAALAMRQAAWSQRRAAPAPKSARPTAKPRARAELATTAGAQR